LLLQKLSAANVTACPSSSLSAAVWPMPLLHLAKDCCASCAAVLMAELVMNLHQGRN
jgi:hypothetical protein